MALPERRARPLGPVLTASLALHLSILILLVISIERRSPVTDEQPPADIAMVFEGHSPERNSAPNSTLPRPSRPGSPVPTPTVPPPSPPTPPPAAALPPPPPPAPPAPAEAQVAPSPPAPTLTPTPTPSPMPAPALSPTPAPPAVAMVIPRPAPLPVPPPPAPAPPRRPAEAHQPRREPAFPSPLAFSFGPAPARSRESRAPSAARAAPAAPSRPGQPATLDLSFSPTTGGSLSPSATTIVDGVAVSTDWLNEVTAWWQRHSYYPPQAGVNGEDGDVTLHMRVDHDGRVSELELVGKSGSQWLDMGGLAIFRGAHLPPLPPDMPDAQIPFDVTIHYILIR